MKKANKILSTFILVTLTGSLISGCNNNSKEENNTTQGVNSNANKSSISISLLNSKGEIQTGLEKVAKDYEKKTGIKMEIIPCPAGGSPFEKISTLYGSGNPPTMAMLDNSDIITLAEEKALDLTDLKWTKDAEGMLLEINNKVYSFPLCLEGRGIIYNKTAIEKTLNKEFDPKSIQSYDDLKNIFAELRNAGMENPMIISKEDWSLGAHQLQYVYETQTGDTKGIEEIIDRLKKGNENLLENKRFNEFIEKFDLLKEYNINKKDPLAAIYEQDPIYLADGDAAFWFNGNWAWPNIVESEGEDSEYGILPYVLGNDKNDFANTSIQASPSKQIMIDRAKATSEQQQAAKNFLDWLVYDNEGQKELIETLALIPPYKNITLKPIDPLGVSVKEYSDAGLIFDAAVVPGDHWKILGSEIQKYLANACNKEELAKAIENYWKAQN